MARRDLLLSSIISWRTDRTKPQGHKNRNVPHHSWWQWELEVTRVTITAGREGRGVVYTIKHLAGLRSLTLFVCRTIWRELETLVMMSGCLQRGENKGLSGRCAWCFSHREANQTRPLGLSPDSPLVRAGLVLPSPALSHAEFSRRPLQKSNPVFRTLIVDLPVSFF